MNGGNATDFLRPLKFALNGLFAAGVHFAALELFLAIGVSSVGLANLMGSVFGVLTSYMGNRVFVFAGPTAESWSLQLRRFVILYGVAATIHGAGLFLWSDLAALDYRAGFILATGLAALVTYTGSARWVFKLKN